MTNGAMANGSRVLFPSRAFHAVVRVLVLQTELVDELGVDPELLLQVHGEGSRVVLRIVDGERNVHCAVVRTMQPLGHLRLIAHRTPAGVYPQAVAEPGG